MVYHRGFWNYFVMFIFEFGKDRKLKRYLTKIIVQFRQIKIISSVLCYSYWYKLNQKLVRNL